MVFEMKVSDYVRKTVDYVAGGLFNKILLIIFLPIFTRFLVPEEFAIYANLMIFFSFASMIYLLGIQQSIFSYFYNKKTDQYQFSLISSVYILLTAVGLLFSTLIIIFRSELAHFSIRSNTHQHLFVYIAVILFFNTIYGITLSFLHIMERSRNYAIISALQNIIVLLLVITYSFNSRFSIDHYFIFLAIASIVASLVGICQIYRIMKKMQISPVEKKYFSLEIISPMLKFGIVMIPGTISMLILQASDRYMLTYLSANTMYDVGIYSAGYRIGMIMHFIVMMVSLVYLPYAMKIAKEPHAQSMNRNMFKYYIVFGSLFGTFIIMYSQEIFQFIIDSNYLTSYKIVFAGVISSFLYGIFNIVNINYYARKKAGNITIAVLLGSILNITLNFILIPKYGIFGAGIASIIAYFFIVIFNYSVAAYLYKIRYPISLVFIGLLILTSAALLNNYFLLSLKLFIIKTVIISGIAAVLIVISKRDKQIQKLIMILKNERKNKNKTKE